MDRKPGLRAACVLALAAGLAITVSSRPAETQPFTLEAVLSAPFPSDLVASQLGDAFAWTFYDQGKRNIWFAQAPDFKATPLTRFDQDDGQEISSLAFSHNGSVIVFVRGQGMNRSGEYPNPSSNPAGAEQAVWAVKTSGGEPWRIGQGSSPVLSPVEEKVVYSLRGTLIMASLDGPAAPQSLFKARGAVVTPSLSPDGTRLAFASSRDDHSFIGIYDLKGKSLSWVAPSVDRDYFPAWSPDGVRLAFIRFPGSKSEPSYWDESSSFSIMVADATSGVAREAWRSPNPTGGFAQTYFDPPLFWGAGGSLVFYSEHEGWMHLYALDTVTEKVTCLTPGDFEVEGANLTKDMKTLIFNSNQGDIDRRHIWRVASAGGTAVAVTGGEGIEVAPSGAAFLQSDARRPMHPVVRVGKENRDLEPLPAGFPLDKMAVPEAVTLSGADGLTLHGQLFKPARKPANGRSPALVFFHGGSRRQMLLGWHPMYYYANAYAMNQYLASLGYVVLSVNYRSGIGYGMEFREALNYGPSGASEYNDVQGAGLWLRARADVDPERIGAWGGSYGGYLTAMALARASDLYKAGVDFHGVHDWALEIHIPPGEPDYKPAFEASPMAWVKTWRSPVLLIAGDDDPDVQFNQTVMLADALRRQGVDREVLIFPDEVHDFLLWRTWRAAYEASAAFFLKRLPVQ